MYNSLDSFFWDLVHLSGIAVGIALLLAILLIIIKLLILWLVVKSAVYNGTKQALEESVTPRMIGLYDQIEKVGIVRITTIITMQLIISSNGKLS